MPPLLDSPKADLPRPGSTPAAVFAGGVVGTSARLLVDLLLPHPPGVFPVGTLLINVAGAFALGFLVSRVPRTRARLRAFLGTGALGSFTTFSAVTVALLQLSASDGAIYLALTLVLGFGAAAAGLRMGRPR